MTVCPICKGNKGMCQCEDEDYDELAFEEEEMMWEEEEEEETQYDGPGDRRE